MMIQDDYDYDNDCVAAVGTADDDWLTDDDDHHKCDNDNDD